MSSEQEACDFDLCQVSSIKPEQVVKQLIEIWKDFDVADDPSWPVRSMKKLLLEYLRALSQNYKSMSSEEPHTVCLMIFIASHKSATVCP